MMPPVEQAATVYHNSAGALFSSWEKSRLQVIQQVRNLSLLLCLSPPRVGSRAQLCGQIYLPVQYRDVIAMQTQHGALRNPMMTCPPPPPVSPPDFQQPD